MELQAKLDEIEAELLAHLSDHKEITLTNQGLLAGDPGISLFFFLKFLKDGKESDLQCIEEIIIHRLNHIEQLLPNPYFCNGLAGFNWLLRYYNTQGVLEIDQELGEILTQLDERVVEAFDYSLEIRNFDFLHGACGLLHYLLTTENAIGHAEKFVARLHETKVIIDDTRIAWTTNITIKDDHRDVYNLGLAHGMPAIVLMLSQLIDKKILAEDALAKELLFGAASFILSEKMNDQFVSTFPNCSSFNFPPSESRLAWCYGDLGVSLALFRAGSILNDTLICNEAINCCLKTTARKSPSETGILDKGICHGMAGVAWIYQRMFHHTNVEAFREAADFWIGELLNDDGESMGENSMGMWTKDGYQPEYNVLEGIGGIGIVLLIYQLSSSQGLEDILLLA